MARTPTTTGGGLVPNFSSPVITAPNYLPRRVGRFTVNACRNPLCASFAVPPTLASSGSGTSSGSLKRQNDIRSYQCRACGKESTIKSNTALVEEYSRLMRAHRRTKREYCPNPACTSHGVPKSLMPSAYRTHGKTPKGDPRFQCKSCEKTFSIGAPTRRHKETTETGEIMRLLVNNVPLRRIREIADIPADRLYNRIDFLADQCRRMAGHKEENLAKAFADRHRVLSCDIQMILANWERNGQIDTVPVYHAATVERSSSYIVASTTDYDPGTDPQETERVMLTNGDFFVPRAWREVTVRSDRYRFQRQGSRSSTFVIL